MWETLLYLIGMVTLIYVFTLLVNTKCPRHILIGLLATLLVYPMCMAGTYICERIYYSPWMLGIGVFLVWSISILLMSYSLLGLFKAAREWREDRQIWQSLFKNGEKQSEQAKKNGVILLNNLPEVSQQQMIHEIKAMKFPIDQAPRINQICERISMEEFNRQKNEYTQKKVGALVMSEDFIELKSRERDEEQLHELKAEEERVKKAERFEESMTPSTREAQKE